MLRYCAAISAGILLLCIGPGCVLAPVGLKSEQSALARAGEPYTRPVGKRELPYVPFQPTWQQVLRRAFSADAGLEAAYDQWAMDVARVEEMGAYPNTPVAVGFNYLFSAQNMTAWDRTTLSAGPDPQTDLLFPAKVGQAARTAFDQARASGDRFAAAKLEVQRKVLSDYFDLVLMDQKIRIQGEDVELLSALEEQAQSRVRAGGGERELIAAQLDRLRAQNDLATMQSQHEAMAADLNVMLNRPAETEILAPTELPDPRPLPADDGTLLTVAVDQNPELAALAEDVKGRADALELARLAYIPDLNPAAAVMGNVSQSLGAVVILPFTTPRIAAEVREAQSALDQSRALARESRLSRGAEFIAALLALRDDERAAHLLETEILPRADELLETSGDGYTAGSSPLGDFLEARRTVLQTRLLIVEARMDREKRLAELESLSGRSLTNLQSLPFYMQHSRPMRLHGKSGG